MYAKDFQSQRSQPASSRQRSHRASGLALTGCRENAKMENRRVNSKVDGFPSRIGQKRKGCSRVPGAQLSLPSDHTANTEHEFAPSTTIIAGFDAKSNTTANANTPYKI